ncbi:uncharacterized protein [Clytia hemisphaerica]|uniref:PiggyBac transposable element-derived protein domain-containing protein n=1 Tax=Clytia hemisphaerica TaxID=252671 RepID=A0A7M5V3V0_9CNID
MASNDATAQQSITTPQPQITTPQPHIETSQPQITTQTPPPQTLNQTADKIQDFLRFVETVETTGDVVEGEISNDVNLHEIYDHDGAGGDLNSGQSSNSGGERITPILSVNPNDALQSESANAGLNSNETLVFVTPTKEKAPPRRSFINNIQKSLDSHYFDNHHYGMVNHEHFNNYQVINGYLGPKQHSEKVYWTNLMPNNIHVQRPCDILPPVPQAMTLLPLASSIETIRDAFDILFPVEMVDLILKHTNQKIKHVQDNLPDPKENSSNRSYYYVRPLSRNELYAFLGLLYARGLLGKSTYKIENLFHETSGHPVFSGTMSRHRLSFILSVLSFDEENEQLKELWKSDRFAAVRELTNTFNERMKSVLIPSQYLTIDDTLYPMTQPVGNKAFNPNDKIRNGLLYKSLSDATVPFIYQVAPYSAKPLNGTGPYYLDTTEDYVKNLVESLPGRNMKGRTITMDQQYSSVLTASWLFSRDITMVGMVDASNPGVPEELRIPKNREENQSTMHWEKHQGNFVLCTYTKKATNTKGKENIFMLTTTRPLLGVTKEGQKRVPSLIRFYENTKKCNEEFNQFSTKTITHQWAKAHFYFLLDVIRRNSLTLHSIKHGKNCLVGMETFDPSWELVMSLVKPFVAERPLTGLCFNVKNKISILLGKIPDQSGLENEEYSRVGESRKRCRVCLDDIAGKGCKKRKDSLNKTKNRCQKCGECICEKHSRLVCKKHEFLE